MEIDRKVVTNSNLLSIRCSLSTSTVFVFLLRPLFAMIALNEAIKTVAIVTLNWYHNALNFKNGIKKKRHELISHYYDNQEWIKYLFSFVLFVTKMVLVTRIWLNSWTAGKTFLYLIGKMADLKYFNFLVLPGHVVGYFSLVCWVDTVYYWVNESGNSYADKK